MVQCRLNTKGWPLTESKEQIQADVRQRFSTLAAEPENERRFPVGPDSAVRLGYDAAEIRALPGALTAPFAGVGNPFLLGAISPDDVVLDLGCGSGMDSVLASRRAARVIGVDMVPAMLARAGAGALEADAHNIDWREGVADALPAEDQSVDVVITNGVFNLCFDKPAVVSEIFRVLKPGGRLQMADILLEPHVTVEELRGKGTWSD
jgi:arsenite methyltransferase